MEGTTPYSPREGAGMMLTVGSSTKIITFTAGSIGWLACDVLLGGVDAPLMAMATLMIIDFITGVIASLKLKKTQSSVGSKGIFKKLGVLAGIIIATILDIATGIHMFRGMLIAGWSVIEVISLIENVDKLGYGRYIPFFVRDKLAQVATQQDLNKDIEEGKNE